MSMHLLEWQKIKTHPHKQTKNQKQFKTQTLTTPNDGNDQEKLELLYIAGEMQNGIVTMTSILKISES